MRALGLGGAGIGAAALIAPTFHDLDELTGSNQAGWKRPWYVKERDIGNPTIDIDYTLMERFDGRQQGQCAHTLAIYYGDARVLAASGLGSAKNAQYYAANANGYLLKDRALAAGANASSIGRFTDQFGWAGRTSAGAPAVVYPTGPSTANNTSAAQTPAQMGVPKWTGTPEEASQMLRAAMRMYGATLVGYSEIDQNWRDHIAFSYEKNNCNSNSFIDNWPPPQNMSGARPIVFEDVDLAYETTSKLVIPNKQLWEVSCSWQGSNELFRRAPAWGSLANRDTFMYCQMTNGCTYNFLQALGYQMMGIIGNDATYMDSGGPPAILSGVGEASRQKLYTLTPEYGAPGRLYSIGTDLPLAPTKPIDAGMYRFCHTCHKCANNCPANAISQESQPSWDIPSTNGIPWNFTVKGTKAFYNNTVACDIYNSESGGCEICWGVCTFTVNHSALIHQVVKGTIAQTSMFNEFFFKMNENFGYGQKDPDSWWNLSLPVFGHDTTIGASDGGYRSGGR